MFPAIDPGPDTIGETGTSVPKSFVSLMTHVVITAPIPVAWTLHQTAPPRGLRISDTEWVSKVMLRHKERDKVKDLGPDLGLVAGKLMLSPWSLLPASLSSTRTSGVPFCPWDRNPRRQGGSLVFPASSSGPGPKQGFHGSLLT